MGLILWLVSYTCSQWVLTARLGAVTVEPEHIGFRLWAWLIRILRLKFFALQSNQTDHTIAILWFIWQTQKLIKQKFPTENQKGKENSKQTKIKYIKIQKIVNYFYFQINTSIGTQTEDNKHITLKSFKLHTSFSPHFLSNQTQHNKKKGKQRKRSSFEFPLTLVRALDSKFKGSRLVHRSLSWAMVSPARASEPAVTACFNGNR